MWSNGQIVIKVCLYITTQCKEMRNQIQHSPRQELDSTHKDACLNMIEAVLNSVPLSNGTTAALAKISDVSY